MVTQTSVRESKQAVVTSKQNEIVDVAKASNETISEAFVSLEIEETLSKKDGAVE